MKKYNNTIETFAPCMSERVIKNSDRAIAFLYFYAVEKNSGASLKQIINDFKVAGLGTPNITKLRSALVKDRRTAQISKNEWRLKSDKIEEVKIELGLDNCLQNKIVKIQKTKPMVENENYVDNERLNELKKIKKFDFSRLIQMLKEINSAYSNGNYISVILLIRAILDHIPLIFGFTKFSEVANQHGTQSFKDSMSHLGNSSRKIADSYLHTHIRKKESLPNKTQVNFSNDLDLLLAEIIRIN